MKLNNYYYILLFLTLTGCKTSVKEDNLGLIKSLVNIREITVPDVESDPELPISEFVNKVNFIPLEFTKQSILGGIKKIVVSEGYIYVIDKLNREGIFKFDMSGKFRAVYGSNGRGPGEHLELTDFSIDEKEHTLYLYDNSQRKIIKFNQKGTVDREIFVDYYGDNFEYDKNTIYQYRTNPSIEEHYNLMIKDNKGNTIGKFFRAMPNGESFSSTIFSRNGSKLYVTPAFSDTIYQLDSNKLEYAYHINFGKKAIKPEDRKKIFENAKLSEKILKSGNYVYIQGGIHDVKDKLFFTIVYNRLNKLAYHENKIDKTIVSSAVYDDLTSLYFFNPIASTPNQLISVYEPSVITPNIDFVKDKLEKKKIPSAVAQNTLTLLNNLKQKGIENVNPSILIYDLK